MRCYVRCYTAIHKWFQKIQNMMILKMIFFLHIFKKQSIEFLLDLRLYDNVRGELILLMLQIFC